MSPKPLLASILMKQQTLTAFEKYGKTTRRAHLLADMDRIVPWKELASVIEPVYPKCGEHGGRPLIALVAPAHRPESTTSVPTAIFNVGFSDVP
jgi:hypothetical protein